MRRSAYGPESARARRASHGNRPSPPRPIAGLPTVGLDRKQFYDLSRNGELPVRETWVDHTATRPPIGISQQGVGTLRLCWRGRGCGPARSGEPPSGGRLGSAPARVIQSMSLERVTITIPSETLSAAKEAADREGVSVSAWLSRAAERAAKIEAGLIADCSTGLVDRGR
ncbi:hypothetical protein SSOG_03195 [Streptomyces himastatinicus ATCC 53653]|uniref:Uncharacterized protein n=2 Tax=Streptomyces violaceusniger group TaxID=2839105 RepID=D9WI98_9ACTN|nr:hypothetical protein SSOG_03195 [Streptomyces himastatinicus ATCC 53653]